MQLVQCNTKIIYLMAIGKDNQEVQVHFDLKHRS